MLSVLLSHNANDISRFEGEELVTTVKMFKRGSKMNDVEVGNFTRAAEQRANRTQSLTVIALEEWRVIADLPFVSK